MTIININDKPLHQIDFYYPPQNNVLDKYKSLSQNPTQKNPLYIVLDTVKHGSGYMKGSTTHAIMYGNQPLPEKLQEIIQQGLVIKDLRREFHAFIKEQSGEWLGISLLAPENYDHSNLDKTNEQIIDLEKQAIKDFILFNQQQGQVKIYTRQYFDKEDIQRFLTENPDSIYKDKAHQRFDEIKDKPDFRLFSLPLEIKTEKEFVDEFGGKYIRHGIADHCFVDEASNQKGFGHCHGGNGRAQGEALQTYKKLINSDSSQAKKDLSITKLSGDCTPYFRYRSKFFNQIFDMTKEKAKRAHY